jgi:hypothetical protein
MENKLQQFQQQAINIKHYNQMHPQKKNKFQPSNSCEFSFPSSPSFRSADAEDPVEDAEASVRCDAVDAPPGEFANEMRCEIEPPDDWENDRFEGEPPPGEGENVRRERECGNCGGDATI